MRCIFTIDEMEYVAVSVTIYCVVLWLLNSEHGLVQVEPVIVLIVGEMRFNLFNENTQKV